MYVFLFFIFIFYFYFLLLFFLYYFSEYINTWDIIYDICPIPSMKLLKVFSESTLENLVKILPSNYNNDK